MWLTVVLVGCLHLQAVPGEEAAQDQPGVPHLRRQEHLSVLRHQAPETGRAAVYPLCSGLMRPTYGYAHHHIIRLFVCVLLLV